MDSKSPDDGLDSTIYLASNVWTRPDGEEPSPWEAVEYVPGDLRVQFLGASLDKRNIALTLNARQQEELTAYLFWLPHGAEVKLTTVTPRKPGGAATG